MPENEITRPQFIINEVDSYETYNKMKQKAGEDWEAIYGNQFFIIEESNDVRGYDEKPKANSENLVPSGGIYNFVKDEIDSVEVNAGLGIDYHNIDEGAHQDIRQEIEDNKNWCHSETEKKTESFTLNLEIPTENWTVVNNDESNKEATVEINNSRIKSTDNPIIGLNLINKTLNDIEAIQGAWSDIKKIETFNYGLKIYARNIPNTIIPIQAHIIRGGVLNG